jgi:hypothetical protein
MLHPSPPSPKNHCKNRAQRAREWEFRVLSAAGRGAVPVRAKLPTAFVLYLQDFCPKGTPSPSPSLKKTALARLCCASLALRAPVRSRALSWLRASSFVRLLLRRCVPPAL